jgi:predicted Fe-Mo cluster-binding NifX family protein
MYVYILLVKMNTIVSTLAAAAMAMLVISIVTVSTTFAVTDNNNNTDVRTEAVENDSSSVIEGDGSSDNNESAKSGINTTVCGPDAAHACQTSSGEK